MPVNLFFIRHGETSWNVERRLQGQVDRPLNDTGRAQAARNGRALGDHLGKRALHYQFIASPLQRARHTMEIAREQMGLPIHDYRIDEALIEISFGSWEGNTLAQVAQFDATRLAAREHDKWGVVPPGGESYAMLHERITRWLHSIQDDCIIVSHGAVMRVLRLQLEQISQEQAPHLEAPQDKVLVYKRNEHGVVAWL